MRLPVLIGFLFLLVGCSYHRVYLTSYSRPTTEGEKTYVLLPLDQNKRLDDLEFQEYATYLHRALSLIDYRRGTRENAEVVILLDYGHGKPITTTESFSLPIYGRTGGGTTYSNALAFDNQGNTAYATGTSYQAPTYGVVGVGNYSDTSTSYPMYLSVFALSIGKEENGKVALNEIWKTTSATYWKLPDLREVMPYLVAGSMNYFGTNTKKMVEVTVSEYDNSKALRFLKEGDVSLESQSGNPQ